MSAGSNAASLFDNDDGGGAPIRDQ